MRTSYNKFNVSEVKYRSIDDDMFGLLTFDSKREMERFKELKLLMRAGKIRDLELQPSFMLQDKFEFNGVKYREIKYAADFIYFDIELNCRVIEEVKSIVTSKLPDYVIRKKLFLKKLSTYEEVIVYKELIL